MYYNHLEVKDNLGGRILLKIAEFCEELYIKIYREFMNIIAGWVTKLMTAMWFIRTSLALDFGFLSVSGWSPKNKFYFIIKKYWEIFLLQTKIKSFKLGENFMPFLGRSIYYDSPFGLAGYESMIARHQKMIKEVVTKPLRNVVDIGANVGFFSLMMRDLFPTISIFAIEPVPNIFHCLKNNLSPYGAKMFCLAFSDRVGQESMKFNELESSRSQIITGPSVKNSGNNGVIVNVPTTTLDKFCLENNIEYIDFLKIDTEGFESHVLKGGQNILSRTRYLHIEINVEGNENYTFSEINSLLFSENFNFQLLYFRNYTDKGFGPLPVGDFLFKNIKLSKGW